MNKKRYLNYIVKQYHTDPNIEIWYKDLTTEKFTNETENKFGITTINYTDTDVGRFKELGRTKAPIGCIAIKVYEAKDEEHQKNMENAFKVLCDDKRITSNGLTEYYNLPTEVGIKFYETQGATDVSDEFIKEEFDDAGAKKVRKEVKYEMAHSPLRKQVRTLLNGTTVGYDWENKRGKKCTITFKPEGFYVNENGKVYEKSFNNTVGSYYAESGINQAALNVWYEFKDASGKNTDQLLKEAQGETV